MSARGMLSVTDYYGIDVVRQRMWEYCGGAADDREPTCAFVSRLPPGVHVTWEGARRHPALDLPWVIAQGDDVARALWDRSALVVHLDLDHVKPEEPQFALLRPHEAFARMAPLVAAVRAELQRLSLPLFALLTGRGYHFTGTVPLDSPVVDRLAEIGRPGALRAPAVATAWYCRPPPRQDEAAVGLGMLLEWLAHRVVRRTHDATEVPVVLNNTGVGPSTHGREALSIDLSYLGDPLETRQVRVAFGTYQMHRLRPDVFGPEAAALDPFAAVPIGDLSLDVLLDEVRTLGGAADLAAQAPARLPDVSAGVRRLLEDYEASPLFRAHRAFYEIAPHPPEAWPQTYDRLDARALVPCVSASLATPNDRLLVPAALQHLVRVLIAEGWHPRHVAGLVTSKYARAHGWGDRWHRLLPSRRAEFDVRVFAGMLATGLDRAVDFNCVSAQEKGLCPREPCARNLVTWRRHLLQEVEP